MMYELIDDFFFFLSNSLIWMEWISWIFLAQNIWDVFYIYLPNFFSQIDIYLIWLKYFKHLCYPRCYFVHWNIIRILKKMFKKTRICSCNDKHHSNYLRSFSTPFNPILFYLLIFPGVLLSKWFTIVCRDDGQSKILIFLLELFWNCY